MTVLLQWNTKREFMKNVQDIIFHIMIVNSQEKKTDIDRYGKIFAAFWLLITCIEYHIHVLTCFVMILTCKANKIIIYNHILFIQF